MMRNWSSRDKRSHISAYLSFRLRGLNEPIRPTGALEPILNTQTLMKYVGSLHNVAPGTPPALMAKKITVRYLMTEQFGIIWSHLSHDSIYIGRCRAPVSQDEN